MKKSVLLIVVLSPLLPVTAQDTDAFIPEGDATYYDFWEGSWYLEVDGEPDTSASRFTVRKTVHPAGWYEDWYMVIDSTTTWTAEAIRAWDKTQERWMYTWISDNGLFQVWEGRKTGDDWHIYKHFDINGDKYLSRQGWIPGSPDRVMRISEKSYDEGKSWELRFREYYVRVGR